METGSSHIIPPGTVTSFPRCLGCGFTVEVQGQVCAHCAMLPQFKGQPTAPKGTIETAPQPEPAYARADYTGNFARPKPQVNEDEL